MAFSGGWDGPDNAYAPVLTVNYTTGASAVPEPVLTVSRYFCLPVAKFPCCFRIVGNLRAAHGTRSDSVRDFPRRLRMEG
jgi:hypothetical protein